jgi:hypothetical protein
MTDEEFRAGLRAARAAYGTGEAESADGSVAGLLLWEAHRRAPSQAMTDRELLIHVRAAFISIAYGNHTATAARRIAVEALDEMRKAELEIDVPRSEAVERDD